MWLAVARQKQKITRIIGNNGGPKEPDPILNQAQCGWTQKKHKQDKQTTQKCKFHLYKPGQVTII